ncbi:MAG: CRISPR-associated protein Cas5 [Verrucomicrobia bacterium]|nr:CRISPR-associated protein Cas5 [Verrucomicrobiota bacterium]
MLSKQPICLRVKGPFACFTRPEFHVERVSYPIITPSAARGILEAILMKPVEKPESLKRHNRAGFRWHILRLGIVWPGRLTPILRNELGYDVHPSYGNARGYSVFDERAQRSSLILSGGVDSQGNRRMLEYLIEACIEVEDELGPAGRTKSDRRWNTVQVLAKYEHMFRRRAVAGQCCYQPFFGCREFSVAEWNLEPDPPQRIIRPSAESQTHEAPEFEDFGAVFRDFNFTPIWDHWPAEKESAFSPRPRNWTDPNDHRDVPEADKLRVRPQALRPLNARAQYGWIVVARKDGNQIIPEP